MRTKLSLIVICLCTLIPLNGFGEESDVDSPNTDKPVGWLRTIDWQQELAAKELQPGMKIDSSSENSAVLVVDGAAIEAASIPLIRIDNPEITKSSYCLSGLIRYENVSEPGYLEMWNHFGESEAYFTRTISESGPMGKIVGSSKWREVKLPFLINSEKEMRPNSLEVNLVLPKGGKVWLSNLTLIETDSPAGFSLGSSVPGMAGMICGILGAIFGCFGGLYGWSRSTGRWWSVMKFFPKFCYLCGAIALVSASISYANGWSWEITYAAALFGVIIIFAVAGNEWYYRQLPREANPLAEERRMRSLDA